MRPARAAEASGRREDARTGRRREPPVGRRPEARPRPGRGRLDRAGPLAAAAYIACATKFKSEPNSSSAAVTDIKGWRWAQGALGFGAFNFAMTPNDPQFQVGGCRTNGGGNGGWLDGAWAVGAASAHPGGANALFADGSVKFIKSTINRQTWWALGTKSGGEVVSADQY